MPEFIEFNEPNPEVRRGDEYMHTALDKRPPDSRKVPGKVPETGPRLFPAFKHSPPDDGPLRHHPSDGCSLALLRLRIYVVHDCPVQSPPAGTMPTWVVLLYSRFFELQNRFS
jgi:hypothetical protein